MGMNILSKVMDDSRASGGQIDGETAFLLYDTYGFPLDLTQDIARENELSVDLDGFAEQMEKQKERGRSAGKFQQAGEISAEAIKNLPKTEFLGYEHMQIADTQVVGILVDGKLVERLEQGQSGIVVLDRTPFYAESGGQVGDTGLLDSEETRFDVRDTIKLAGVFHGHVGRLEEGSLETRQRVRAAVDGGRRHTIVLHHSATHLMHAALRDILGNHVEQRGSLVAPDHLRFDFSHPRQVTPSELRTIEREVNRAIRENPATTVAMMDFDEALETGAMALFGEKYGDRVRVMRFGDLSTELCGGTHVDRVGDIGQFRIVSESAIGAGIRRIVAVAGEQAVENMQQVDTRLHHIASMLKVSPDAVDQRLEQLLERSRALEKEVDALKSSLASSSSDELAASAVDIDGIKVLTSRNDGADARALRDSVDHLKDVLGSAIIVLAGAENGKVRIAAGVTKDLTASFRAGDLVNFVAAQVGGKGGGRPDFAQAGGNQPEKLDAALASVLDWVGKKN
jgi:alanyl-tRNA synthetase